MKKQGVYILTNRVNGKQYVGQSWDIDRRLKEHLITERKGCPAVFYAIKKYGSAAFDVEIIEYLGISQEALNAVESWHINYRGTLTPNGYNLKTEGLGGKLSEETKHKISEANSGEGNPFFGKTLSIEHRQNLSDVLSGENHPNFGKKASAETRQKQSNAKKGKPTWNKKGNSRPEMRGENNPMYGKRGEAHPSYGKPPHNRHPEYTCARWFFFIELANLTIEEKREAFLLKYSGVSSTTRYRWLNTWQAELDPKWGVN